MEVDGFDSSYKTVGNRRLKLYEVEHRSLSQKQIEDLMQQEVDYISGLCGVDVSTVGAWHQSLCSHLCSVYSLMSQVYCFVTLTGTARSSWTSIWITRTSSRPMLVYRHRRNLRPPRRRQNPGRGPEGRFDERPRSHRNRARQRRLLNGSVLQWRSHTCVPSAAMTILRRPVHWPASISSVVPAGANM